MKFCLFRTLTLFTIGTALTSAILLQSCSRSDGKQLKSELKSELVHESDRIASTLASDPDTITQQNELLVVYYFHTSFRCKSCIKLEQLTSEAVTNGFSGQLKNGRVVFKTINVEEPGNEHFNDDYKLVTKSVILSDQKNGKEDSWKNLEKVWTLLGNEQKFVEYIQTEVKALL